MTLPTTMTELSTSSSSSTVALRPAVDNAASSLSTPSRLPLSAYLTLIGSFLALFATFGLITSFGAFQRRYTLFNLSHESPSTISWIGSSQLFLFFLLGFPTGLLFDAHGPTLLLCSGSVLLMLSLFITSIAGSHFAMYIVFHGLLFGVSCALIFFPAMAALATHFAHSRWKATVLGIASSGTSVGGVVWPFLLDAQSPHLPLSWPNRVRLVAGVAGACCLLGCLLISRVLPTPSPESRKSPQTTRSYRMPQFRDLCRDSPLITFVLSCCLTGLGLYTPYFYLPSLSSPYVASSLTLPVINAASCLGRILPPLLADWLGTFNLIIPSSLICGVLMLALWPLSSAPIIFAFAAFYGFASGSWVSLVSPAVVRLSPRKEQIGERFGIVFTCNSLAVLVGPPIAGALINVGFRAVLIYSGVVVILGSILMLGVPWLLRRQWQREQKRERQHELTQL